MTVGPGRIEVADDGAGIPAGPAAPHLRAPLLHHDQRLGAGAGDRAAAGGGLGRPDRGGERGGAGDANRGAPAGLSDGAAERAQATTSLGRTGEPARLPHPPAQLHPHGGRQRIVLGAAPRITASAAWSWRSLFALRRSTDSLPKNARASSLPSCSSMYLAGEIVGLPVEVHVGFLEPREQRVTPLGRDRAARRPGSPARPAARQRTRASTSRKRFMSSPSGRPEAAHPRSAA